MKFDSGYTVIKTYKQLNFRFKKEIDLLITIYVAKTKAPFSCVVIASIVDLHICFHRCENQIFHAFCRYFYRLSTRSQVCNIIFMLNSADTEIETNTVL